MQKLNHARSVEMGLLQELRHVTAVHSILVLVVLHAQLMVEDTRAHLKQLLTQPLLKPFIANFAEMELYQELKNVMEETILF